jgi:hypothetical protein
MKIALLSDIHMPHDGKPIWDTDVKEHLYSCVEKLKKTPNVDINSIDKPWWIDDTIKELENKHYLLEVEIESARGSRKNFIVEFEIPEIERK